MQDRIVTSITLYGEIDGSASSWLKWYEDAKGLVSALGYECNHVAIESTSLHSGKVHKIKSYEKRLLIAVESGDEVECMGVMSLPPDCSSAVFDYDVDLVRELNYVSLVVNKSDFDRADRDLLVDVLKRHVALKEGEIYEMDREECPQSYAARVNRPSFYTTLKVIQKLG